MKYYNIINIHKLNEPLYMKDYFNNYIDKDIDILLNNIKLEYYNINNYLYEDNYSILENKKEFKSNILKFDLSMLGENLYKLLYDIICNYNNILLYNIDDIYILKYKEYSKNNIGNILNKLKYIFYSNIKSKLNISKINNIIKDIKNKKFKNILIDNIKYAKFIKTCIYENYFLNYNNNSIIDNFMNVYKNNDNSILFNITNFNKTYNNDLYLSKLYQIYNKLYPFFENYNLEDNIDQKFKILKTNINILDLFDKDKINLLYDNLTYNKSLYISMSHIFNKKFNIITDNNNIENINREDFNNNISYFLNEFLKKELINLTNNISYNYILGIFI